MDEVIKACERLLQTDREHGVIIDPPEAVALILSTEALLEFLGPQTPSYRRKAVAAYEKERGEFPVALLPERKPRLRRPFALGTEPLRRRTDES